MPCDSMTTVTLVLDSARLVVLDAAMVSLNFKSVGAGMWTRGSTTVVLKRSSLEISGGYRTLTSEIQRATSVEIVKGAAAKNGWKLSWLTANTATATKQTFGR